MTHVCFATNELYPLTRGGAGTLIYNSLRTLKQHGHQVSVLLDVDDNVYQQACQLFKSDSTTIHLDGLYSVGQLAADLPRYPVEAFGEWYYWQSFRLYWAVQKLCQTEAIDFVEFSDFFGPAYYSLAGKACGLAFSSTRLGIRLHTPWEMLLQFGDGVATSSYVLAIRYLERGSLRLAEHVLSASEGYWQSLYSPSYEAGLGDHHISKPVVTHWPRPEASDASNARRKVLFYGRLQPIKGLDRLLAACLDVSERLLDLEFWFVGSDSELTRDSGAASYRDLLNKRIPPHLRNRFVFPGRLSITEMGKLLSSVRFAVFPSFFESFCYAAHELRRAGIAIIVSNLPSFMSYFRHEENALVFDGTTTDLIAQMERLNCDAALRTRLEQPDASTERPLGTFYDSLPPSSWMSPLESQARPPSLLVVIEDDGLGNADRTIASVSSQLEEGDDLVVLTRVDHAPATIPLIFMDNTYSARSAVGDVVSIGQVRTRDALLILPAGDELVQDTLSRWRRVLAKHSPISFVRSWLKRSSSSDAASVDRHPIEICLDQLLFLDRPLRQRTLMRTRANIRLDDVFDLRQGPLGEIGYLWKLDEHHGPGVTFPEVHTHCRPEPPIVPAQLYRSIASYMVAQDMSRPRQKSLAMRSLMNDREPSTRLHRLATEMRALWQMARPKAMLRARELIERWRHLRKNTPTP